MDTEIRRCRLNTPRIREIEEQIQKLVAELVTLVNPDDQDRQNLFENLRDCGWESVSDHDACIDALDNRDCVVMEAMDHLRHGRKADAEVVLNDAALAVTLDDLRGTTTEFTGS